jgi:hypothetical protein
MTSGVRIATKPGHASCVSLCASEVDAAEQTTTHRAARNVRHNAPIETLLDPSHAGRQPRRLCRCAALAKHPGDGAAVPAPHVSRVRLFSFRAPSLLPFGSRRQFCAMIRANLLQIATGGPERQVNQCREIRCSFTVASAPRQCNSDRGKRCARAQH